MAADTRGDLGRTLRQYRRMIPLTVHELAAAADVSTSYISRIERGERFPSAHILRRFAKPLHMEEAELMLRAGYLSSEPTTSPRDSTKLDPYAGMVLAQEPVEVHRAVVAVLTVLKGMARSLGSDGGFGETRSSRRGKSEQVGRDKRQRTYH